MDLLQFRPWVLELGFPCEIDETAEDYLREIMQSLDEYDDGSESD